MKPNRVVWADILRILAMFFVVFIHVSPLPQNISWSTLHYFINFAIVKSCIALFFMLSGALLLAKTESYQTFFKKRFFKVIFPWFIWTFIYMLVQVFIDCKHVKIFSEWKYLFEITLFTRFWILPVLVGLYLLTPALRILVNHAKKTDLYYLMLLWMVFVSILPFLHNGPTFPISFPAGLFSQVMMCLGFFIGGYVLLQIPKKLITYKSISALLIIGILITILAAFSKSGDKLVNIEGFAYSIFSPGMVILTAGIFLLFYQLGNIFDTWNDNTKHLITSFSIASFGVYLTHEVLFNLLKLFMIRTKVTYLLNTDLLTDYLRAIVIFFVATLLIMGIQKVPYLKRIVP